MNATLYVIMLRSLKFAAFALLVALAYTNPLLLVRGADTTPPVISNVEVTDVTQTSATVTWQTNEYSDSLVNYGLQEDYGIVRVPNTDKIVHTISLDNLEPGRTYYFRVVSSDADGNQGISANYKLVTEGSQQVQETQTQTVENIVQQIQQIQQPEVLQEIVNQTVQTISGITRDLAIVGPPTVIPETTSAKVKWTTDRTSTSEVVFSPSGTYTEGSYDFSQSSTDGKTTDHEVNLIGLEPFTEYHFKVRSKDDYGITGESRDFTFKTKASLPEIRNLRIVKVEENSATLAWDTTVPAKALIEYQDLTTGEQNSIGRPTLASTHQMRISDLTLGTRYVAFVIAENAGGDRVKSSPITFITVRDTEAPIISNVTNDSTLFPGGESRIQTIIEWDTDEPSYCSLSYREGISAGVEPTIIEPENKDFVEKHVEVVVDFAPATVYQFWLTCADEAGNSVDSENYVLFTPIQEKNIIDIILENFQSTFGWVKNIGGG